MKKIMWVLMLNLIAFTSCKKDKDDVESVTTNNNTTHSLLLGGTGYDPTTGRIAINNVTVCGGMTNISTSTTLTVKTGDKVNIILYPLFSWGGTGNSTDIHAIIYIDNKPDKNLDAYGGNSIDINYIVK